MADDHTELMRVIERLVAELRSNTRGWENATLESYLEALAAWIGDMDGYYAARNEDLCNLNPWRVMGDALQAARMYE